MLVAAELFVLLELGPRMTNFFNDTVELCAILAIQKEASVFHFHYRCYFILHDSIFDMDWSVGFQGLGQWQVSVQECFAQEEVFAYSAASFRF